MKATMSKYAPFHIIGESCEPPTPEEVSREQEFKRLFPYIGDMEDGKTYCLPHKEHIPTAEERELIRKHREELRETRAISIAEKAFWGAFGFAICAIVSNIFFFIGI